MDPKNPFQDLPAESQGGEGNREADEAYREGATDYARSGKAEGEARKAEKDIEEHPEEYARAAEAGKRPSAGDLPSDLKSKKSKH